MDKITTSETNLETRMLENHAHPSPSQDNFQEAIYIKRDFYIHKIPERNIKNYEDVKRIRENKCSGASNASAFKLTETQTLLSNFINPSTPYKSLLIYHGTGIGKTCTAVPIAEKFKPMVEKYGMRIHILVPGPLNKAQFLKGIITCTGETYLKMYQDKTIVMNEFDIAKMKKNAVNIINQYYRIMSYRSFYKKVLGEKIREKTISGNKIKITNRKTESGEYERDVSIDRIYNLDNTLLIVDEAHNLTDNEYGKAVKKIINNSKNLRIILMTATPAKNLADDIIELINYLRPAYAPMQRDKIFTNQKNYMMEFKPNGKEYLRKMVRGYVSYLRGADPLTFAERIDIGEIPPGLSFTHVTRCYMLPFQLKTYTEVIQAREDSLDKKSEAAANFVFPGLPKNKTEKNGIQGYYGIDGMNEVRLQIKTNPDVLNERIANTVLAGEKIENPSTLFYLTDNNKVISGDIFNEQYLKYFSIKFYTALIKINTLVYGQRNSGLVFVYSNLVKSGIELFQEVLHKNGYLEYQENIFNYNLKNDTRCYFCNLRFGNHNLNGTDIPNHDFYPATYVTVTGKSEENLEQIPEEKHRLIETIFNNAENKTGKFIKIILGSKVLGEGITLVNIKEIHILDVHYNLGRIDQVIGRGIRFCKHYDLITEDNRYPKVEINKYVVSLESGLSSEEILYQKAELKYKLIKETERIIQEEAIDCPLNRNGNIFPEELEKYKNCEKSKTGCPAICGYMTCEFKCGDKFLNAKYYDPKKDIYRKLTKEELDYSTYNNSLAEEEIVYAKSKIKEMYRTKYIYLLDDILNQVRTSYPVEKRDMFDDYYVYQALDDLIPITGNDFNNFKDTIMDKFYRPGYLIYRNRYYIFQPFDENEYLPMYYRQHYKPIVYNTLSLKDYVHNLKKYQEYKEKYHEQISSEEQNVTKTYDFTGTQEYYDTKEEFEYVGIIDQAYNRKKNKNIEERVDEFKIRIKRPKILSKKRETGVPSYKGSVCNTSKNKKFLIHIAHTLKLVITGNDNRNNICDLIRNKLYDLEKYSTTKDGNKFTYLIIPINHPNIPFPLNLEDRIKYIIDDIEKGTRMITHAKVEKINLAKGQFSDIHYTKYDIIFDKSMDKIKDSIENHGGVKTKEGWVIHVE